LLSIASPDRQTGIQETEMGGVMAATRYRNPLATWIPSPNFWPDRQGHNLDTDPRFIVIHTTVSSIDSAIRSFQSPAREASAHYLVGLDGRLVQMVDEGDAAWHAGSDRPYNPNDDSIGIEHEDGGDYNGVRPDALYLRSAQLVADICKRYGMSCDDAHIKPHKFFAPTACPDALDVARIIRMAAEILTPASAPTVAGTPIMGSAGDMGRKMFQFLSENKAGMQGDWVPLINAYLVAGQQEGVRGDGAFCQAIKETNWCKFTGDVKAGQNNFCGLGATGGGNPGLSFPSIDAGVRAHLRHLLAYATTGPLPPDTPQVDPRGLPAAKRGSATTFLTLGGPGKWAPSPDYGVGIETLLARLLAIPDTAPLLTPTVTGTTTPDTRDQQIADLTAQLVIAKNDVATANAELHLWHDWAAQAPK
jgi:hypothetical protein